MSGIIETAAWQDEYPFESHRLELDGHSYHYLDEGQGLPVVMVHGNPTWSFYWRHLVTKLSGRYRAIAVDHIGCGLSDKPAAARFRLIDHAANLSNLIRQLKLEQVTLVVHDWGGPIGLTAALDNPDRSARLVILNTGAFPPPAIPLRIRLCRIPGIGPFMMRRPNLFARLALTMAMHRNKLSPLARAGLLAPYDCAANRRGIQQFVEDIPSSARHPSWEPLVRLQNELPTLDHLPTSIIWGMRDWCFTSRCLEMIEQLLPSADVHRLEDVGHYVMEDACEQTTELISQFLADSDDRMTGGQE